MKAIKWMQAAYNLPLITTLIALNLPMTGHGQSGEILVPERFGVVDITPNGLSYEAEQNSQPSLAVGTGNYFNDFVAHAYRPQSDVFNYYYTSVNGGTVWTNAWEYEDWGMTLDWSSGGTFYAAYPGLPYVLNADISFGLPSGPLTPYLFFYQGYYAYEEPWIRTVNVGGNDHTYIAFGNLNDPESEGTASVFYTFNGPSAWNLFLLDKQPYEDSPGVRLAITPDGANVYALFQRWKTWEGQPGRSDHTGQVVLMRDDNSTGNFTGLGSGTLVADDIRLPFATTLGNQSLSSSCDVAVNPQNRDEVYVAYVGFNTLSSPPYIAVKHSTDGGNTFTLVYETANYSGLPSLAILNDGTVGLLYLAQNGANLEVIFSKAPQGNFSKLTSRTLASWQNGLGYQYDPYVGDYFQLRAVGANFYGVFSAYNQPTPANFPSGVYYQRNVQTGGHLRNNFWLKQSGTLYDASSEPAPVAPSIDAFFFYDKAPAWESASSSTMQANLQWRSSLSVDLADPLSGTNHIIWPVLALDEPQFVLQSSSMLGLNANWMPVTNGIIQANGQFEFAPDLSLPQQFFRVAQNSASGQFPIFVAADDNGSVSPGSVTNAGLTSQVFTATANNGYAPRYWYLDGAVVSTGTSNYTLTNIQSEHTLLVTFAPTNASLAVSVTGAAVPPGPAFVNSNYNYQVIVANNGLGTATGVILTNLLDPNVAFQSATSSLGSVTNLGSVILANIGTLSNGASATITIGVTLNAETNITDAAVAICDQAQPVLTTSSKNIITPVTITADPTNQVASSGGTASFNVAAAGTAPLNYQWLFNGTPVAGATNATLTISNVTLANSGTYTVNVVQMNSYGFRGVLTTPSGPATLTVN